MIIVLLKRRCADACGDIDPKKHTLHLVRAMDQTVGQELLSHILKRKKGLMAVNGSFFKSGGRFSGEESYVTFYNGSFEKVFPGRVSIFGKIDTQYHTDIIEVKCSLQEGYHIPIPAVNTGEANSIVLFTEQYHRSTMTLPGRTEVSVDKSGSIQFISPSGNQRIPEGGYVVSFSPEAWKEHGFSLSKGGHAKIVYTFLSDKNLPWSQAQFVITGVPTLLQNGVLKPILQCKSKVFVEGQHARTAVGIRKDGHVILLHVEGHSENMDLSLRMCWRS